MDNRQIGKLIRSLRVEKQMTQLQLAEQIGVTDKAVSKWERGLGGPDISLLPDLSQILGVNIEKILAGDLQPNESDRGDMERTKFYICPDCGGIITSTSDAEISCCGRKLMPLEPRQPDEGHCLQAGVVEGEYYLTGNHAMTREHYISFIARVTQDKALVIKLYPEQGIEIRIPKMHGSTLYYYCTQHGLMEEMMG